MAGPEGVRIAVCQGPRVGLATGMAFPRLALLDAGKETRDSARSSFGGGVPSPAVRHIGRESRRLGGAGLVEVGAAHTRSGLSPTVVRQMNGAVRVSLSLRLLVRAAMGLGCENHEVFVMADVYAEGQPRHKPCALGRRLVAAAP